MNVLESIAEFYKAREDYDRAHEISVHAHALMKDAERVAVEKMLDAGTNSLGLDDGTHVSLRKRFSCSVTENNEDQIREWLTEVEGDDAQFIVEKVHKPALVEWMRKKFEETMDEGDVPDFLNLNTSPALTVRGWKSRMKENQDG